MNDSINMLRKFGLSPTEAPPKAHEEEEEGTCSAFGYVRGLNSRCLMVEFRKRNGNRMALPYSWLGLTTLDPSQGITLKFAGDTVYRVTIEGSNLGQAVEPSVNLYEKGLLRHRITWIREMDPEELKRIGGKAPTIDRIRIEEFRPGGEWEEKQGWVEL